MKKLKYSAFSVLAIAVVLLGLNLIFAGQGNSAEVTLAWEKPEQNFRLVDGYNIYYAPEDEDLHQAAPVEINDPEITEATIGGLQEGTVYNFAATSFGEVDGAEKESEFSETISYQVPEDDNGDATEDDNGDSRFGCSVL